MTVLGSHCSWPEGAPETSYTQGSCFLVLQPKTRGIPETMVCKMLMFMWSFGSMNFQVKGHTALSERTPCQRVGTAPRAQLSLLFVSELVWRLAERVQVHCDYGTRAKTKTPLVRLLGPIVSHWHSDWTPWIGWWVTGIERRLRALHPYLDSQAPSQVVHPRLAALTCYWLWRRGLW